MGFQLCRRWFYGGEEHLPFPVVELNVLLSHPPGERVHILAHGEALRVRDAARELAAFLQVPVMDTTLEG